MPVNIDWEHGSVELDFSYAPSRLYLLPRVHLRVNGQAVALRSIHWYGGPREGLYQDAAGQSHTLRLRTREEMRSLGVRKRYQIEADGQPLAEGAMAPVGLGRFFIACALITVVLWAVSLPFILNARGLSPIMLPVYAGTDCGVRLALALGADPNVAGEGLEPPLYYAVGMHDYNIARMLLEAGADPGGTGTAPIFVAALRGRTDLVRLLLEHGAGANQGNAVGTTPLMAAAMFGHEEAGLALIQHGAAVDNLNDDGDSALAFAASSGAMKLAAALIEAGAAVDTPNRHGHTPLFHAAREGYPELARLLLEKGARAEVRSRQGMSPLYAAAAAGHQEIVRMLLEHGAEPNARPRTAGDTPLHRAALVGDPEVVELLLEHGAEPGALDSQGCTPLHAAAAMGRRGAAALVLEAGVDVNSCDHQGRTPLDYARAGGHGAVAEWLLSQGAADPAPCGQATQDPTLSSAA